MSFGAYGLEHDPYFCVPGPEVEPARNLARTKKVEVKTARVQAQNS